MVEGHSRVILKSKFECHRQALTSMNFADNVLPYATLRSVQRRLAGLQDDLFTQYENIERLMYFRMLDDLSDIECIDLLGAVCASMKKTDEGAHSNEKEREHYAPPRTPKAATEAAVVTEDDAIVSLLAPSEGDPI